MAGAVLTVLARQLTADVYQAGGELTPAARQLLDALYRAAHRQVAEPELLSSQQFPTGTTLTVVELAARMGCSTRWARHLLETGRVPGRKSGGTWLAEDPYSEAA